MEDVTAQEVTETGSRVLSNIRVTSFEGESQTLTMDRRMIFIEYLT